MQRLEALIEKTNDPKVVAAFQKELAKVKREWTELYEKHITDYRRQFQMHMIEYAKVRAINADLASGKEPLKTSLMTSATIRQARKPVARKQKKDKQIVERKRKK